MSFKNTLLTAAVAFGLSAPMLAAEGRRLLNVT